MAFMNLLDQGEDIAMLQQWLGDANVTTTRPDNRPKRDELGMPYCPPLVFLDTSALKLAADRRVRGIQRRSTVRWGPHDVAMDWVQFVELNPNANVRAAQRKQISALPLIAHMADRNRVRVATHMEVLWGSTGCPDIEASAGLGFCRYEGCPSCSIVMTCPCQASTANRRETRRAAGRPRRSIHACEN